MTDPDSTTELHISLCHDCIYVDANGMDEGVDPEWPGFREEWAGWLFGPRLDPNIVDEEEAFDYHSTGHYVRPGSTCDGCGTTLGGQRWDYLAVPTPRSTR